MKGLFWGVGVGPGDPALLTIKAVEVIGGAEIIVSPQSGGEENVALGIVKDYIGGKTLVEVAMPMTRDRALLEKSHDEAAATLGRLLDQGKTIAFLTLGDPSIYSSLMYVYHRLAAAGYDCRLVPGITSFCAAAACLGESLCENKELLHIIPASYSDLDYALSLKGNKVLMKSGKSLGAVKEKLKGKRVKMVERATMTGQKLYQSLEEIDENAGYFSILTVKE